MDVPSEIDAPARRSVPFVRPMVGRDRTEPHRASTPLELLFDLSFVVAVSSAAATLHHQLAEGHVRGGITGYLMVFFAIWWAWMNFTWFASAYDTDDVPYRLLTLLQIAGVLVLAVGVPDAATGDFGLVTVGYLIMRVGLLSLWIRAARGTGGGLANPAWRYALGIAVLQACWVLRLGLPASTATASFLALVVGELLVPVLAEPRGRETGWHPEHIAERYSLFTIIVIGECILSATVAVRSGLADGGISVDLLAVAAGGLLLVAGIWWLYFQRPAEEGLKEVTRGAFAWGYAHYGLFAALAGLGAALALAGQGRPVALSPTGEAVAVAVPVAVALVLMAVMQGLLHGEPVSRTVGFGTAAAVVVAIGFVGAGDLGLHVLAMGVVVAALTAIDLVKAPVPPAR